MVSTNGYDFFFDQYAYATKTWAFFYFIGLAMLDELEERNYDEIDLLYLVVEFYA